MREFVLVGIGLAVMAVLEAIFNPSYYTLIGVAIGGPVLFTGVPLIISSIVNRKGGG